MVVLGYKFQNKLKKDMLIEFKGVHDHLLSSGHSVLSRVFTVFCEVPLSFLARLFIVARVLLGIGLLISSLLIYSVVESALFLPCVVIEYLVVYPWYYIITGKNHEELVSGLREKHSSVAPDEGVIFTPYTGTYLLFSVGLNLILNTGRSILLTNREL